MSPSEPRKAILDSVDPVLVVPGEQKIAPSILSADFGALAADAARVRGATDWLHVDVMDGHFVPNLTIGPPVLKCLRRHNDAFFDCHLMMENPGKYLAAFKDAGADLTTVHIEVGRTEQLIEAMRGLDLFVGVALNPETEVEAVEPYLSAVDLVLVMSVHPGFGGQKFMSEVVEKVATIRSILDGEGLSAALEVDGGIDRHTITTMARAGAQVFVAGSAVFGQDDPSQAVLELAKAAEVQRAV